ncbi:MULTISPECIES: hypothetical protein [Polaromonas]|uniref:Fatty acid desaturase n=1 Tax=Polaromonas aquatica TaxID=332657 RepID=A0ABW1U3Q4_9BURK
MSDPSRHHPVHHITLAQLQRIKDWHAAQYGVHPVERQLWEAVMTVWVMGWTGWVPAYVFEASWAYPLCLLGICMPRLYVHWRAHAHDSGRLRCDWLHLVY